MSKEIGYVKVELPAILTRMAALVVHTSINTGTLNVEVSANIGEETVCISGQLHWGGTFYAVDLKIPVQITQNQVTRLSMPYLGFLRML